MLSLRYPKDTTCSEVGLKTIIVCCGKKRHVYRFQGENLHHHNSVLTRNSVCLERWLLCLTLGETNHAKEGHRDAHGLCTEVHLYIVSILPLSVFFEHWSLFIWLFCILAARDHAISFSVCFSNSSYSLTSQIQNSGELIRLVMVLCIASRYWLGILHWNAVKEPQTKNFRCPKLRAFQLGWKFPLITSSAEAFNIV